MTSKSSKSNKEKLIFFSKQELIEQWIEMFPNLGNPDSIEDNALAGYILTPHGYVKATPSIETELVTR